MEHEVQDMLRKGAIMDLDPKQDRFLSSLFLVKKRYQVRGRGGGGGGESPSTQSKGLGLATLCISTLRWKACSC